MIRALEIRFGTVPGYIATAVESVTDLERLDELHCQAITIDSLAAFETLLPAPT